MESEIKWIKLSTKMFDDPRVQVLQIYPDYDALVLAWIQMLFTAGKNNQLGFLPEVQTSSFLLDHIEKLKSLNLIAFENGVIQVCDWDKFIKIDRECIVSDGDYEALRKFVFHRDDYTCVYCGERSEYLEADHVMPKSRGGLDTLENLVCACRNCNRSKKDKTPEEWRLKDGRQQEVLLHETQG